MSESEWKPEARGCTLKRTNGNLLESVQHFRLRTLTESISTLFPDELSPACEDSLFKMLPDQAHQSGPAGSSVLLIDRNSRPVYLPKCEIISHLDSSS